MEWPEFEAYVKSRLPKCTGLLGLLSEDEKRAAMRGTDENESFGPPDGPQIKR